VTVLEKARAELEERLAELRLEAGQLSRVIHETQQKLAMVHRLLEMEADPERTATEPLGWDEVEDL